MKKLFAVLCLFFLGLVMGSAQDANALLGLYLTEGGKAKVRIDKEGDKYVGTLVWTARANVKDSKNPDEAERSKPIVGKRILRGFVYSGKNVWEKGTIYDPESGKTYSCKITRQDDGSLKVRGFIGVSLLGRTSVWTKASN